MRQFFCRFFRYIEILELTGFCKIYIIKKSIFFHLFNNSSIFCPIIFQTRSKSFQRITIHQRYNDLLTLLTHTLAFLLIRPLYLSSKYILKHFFWCHISKRSYSYNNLICNNSNRKPINHSIIRLLFQYLRCYIIWCAIECTLFHNLFIFY